MRFPSSRTSTPPPLVKREGSTRVQRTIWQAQGRTNPLRWWHQVCTTPTDTANPLPASGVASSCLRRRKRVVDGSGILLSIDCSPKDVVRHQVEGGAAGELEPVAVVNEFVADDSGMGGAGVAIWAKACVGSAKSATATSWPIRCDCKVPPEFLRLSSARFPDDPISEHQRAPFPAASASAIRLI
jgi:hypothetical protein